MKAHKKHLENTREMEIIEGRGGEGKKQGKVGVFFHKSASPLQKFFISTSFLQLQNYKYIIHLCMHGITWMCF